MLPASATFQDRGMMLRIQKEEHQEPAQTC